MDSNIHKLEKNLCTAKYDKKLSSRMRKMSAISVTDCNWLSKKYNEWIQIYRVSFLTQLHKWARKMNMHFPLQIWQ